MKYKQIGNDDKIINARYNSFMGESYSYLVGLLDRKLNSDCSKEFKKAIDKEFSETLKTITGTYLSDSELQRIKESYIDDKDGFNKSDYRMIRYIYSVISNAYGKNIKVDIKTCVASVIDFYKQEGLKGAALDHILLSIKL